LNKTLKLLIFPALSASQFFIFFLFYLSFYLKGHLEFSLEPAGIIWGGLIATTLTATGQIMLAGLIWHHTKTEVEE